MKRLGIYFGLNAVSIIETSGKKVINSIKVPVANRGEYGDQRINASILDELRSRNIKSDTSIITLASKDLLVRTFDLPLLPRDTIPAAVHTEAIKYIPFKVEDVVYDYKVALNRKDNKNNILFVGIKSDELDNRYLSIMSAAMLKPKKIEYAVFSALKLMKISGVKEKGLYAFIDIDLEDESNITILADGFPQFSRTLKVSTEELATGKTTIASVLEKLGNEIRISLDFYQRKFPNRTVKDVVFLVKNDLRYEIENISRDLGITAKFITLPKDLEPELGGNIGAIKAYAASLDMKVPYEIDLISAKDRVRKAVLSSAGAAAAAAGGEKIEINKGLVFAGVVLVAAVFGVIQFNKIVPLQKEIQQILSQRLSLSTVSTSLSLEELTGVKSSYKKKVDTLDKLFKDRVYFTSQFDYIPKLIPNGVWLTAFEYSEQQNRISFRGASFLEDSEAELKAINDFLVALQSNDVFSKAFKNISLLGARQGEVKNIKVTLFEIECK